ncbi:MAG: transglutaminase domain-containing protein [Kofleriaceae bacterium]
MRRLLLAGLVAVACAPALVQAPATDWPAPPAPVTVRRADYELRWNGALIGFAHQRDDGARLTRRERLVVRRGDVVVQDDLDLTIDREGGRPVLVRLERRGVQGTRGGVARATTAGWDVRMDGEPAVALPPATPFEDALARAGTDGGFVGPVLLAGWGFAIAPLRIEPVADGWQATLEVDGSDVRARIVYGADGFPDRVDSGDGVTAARRPLDETTPRFDPVEVVDASALEVPPGAGRVLVFPEAQAPLPALPGQDVRPAPRGGWRVELGVGFAGELPPGPDGPDRAAEIASLTHQVARAVADDLGATAGTVGAARAAARGDCTTHALSLVALAEERGVPTRVVTGLRREDDRLVRHRWVVAWTGTRWLPVDPTFDESPAAPRLIGLAVHGPRAADLAVADAVVFDRLGGRVALPTR